MIKRRNIYPRLNRFYSLIFVFFFCLMQQMGETQCRIETLHDQPITIESIDEVSLRFLVQNAQLDQLALDGQGICGVRIEFIHQDVSDLNITLYGPDGQQVILVGPATETSGGVQVFGLAHDLTFIPSTETAMPDPGMSAVWDNRDPDWGTINAYAGSYYPFSGHLDIQLGQGNVNGIWELVITDQFLGVVDPSTFNSFELIFCDNNLECTMCEAEAGSFRSDTITVCEGQNFNLNTIYESGPADPDLYTDILLTFSGNTLFARDMLPVIEGDFESYVVNILKEQEAAFRQRLNGMTRATLLNMANMEGGEFCIDLTEPLHLSIVQSSNISAIAPDSLLLACGVTELVLDGSSSTLNDSTTVRWRDGTGQIISMEPTASASESGIYSLIIQDGTCYDSVVTVVSAEIDQLSLTLDATVDAINCTTPQATLSFDSDMVVNGISWQDEAGTELGSDLELMVEQGGVYHLELQGDGDCMLSDSIAITGDFVKPKGSVEVDTITCLVTEVEATALNVSANHSLNWYNDQNDVISSADMIKLREGGSYSLEIIGQNGCDSLIAFEVVMDTLVPEINGIPTDTSLTCISDTIGLDIVSDPQSTYTLSQSRNNGPFQLISGQPLISTDGDYRFTFNFDNGCISRREMTVSDFRSDVTIADQSAEINCTDEEASLSTSLDTAIYDISWSGGSLQGSTDPFPIVQDSGTYQFVGTNRMTGCPAMGQVIVTSDRDDPTEIVSGDTSITCLDPIAEVFILTDEDATAFWVAEGDTVFSPEISVGAGTTLDYFISGANGCNVNGIWIIADNQDAPSISVPDQIDLTCSNETDTISIAASGLSDFGYVLTSTDTIRSDDFIIADASLQSVFAVGENGCITTQDVTINIDQTEPDLAILTNDTTVCTPTDLDFISIVDGDDEISYQWVANGNVLGNQAQLTTDVVGTIVLTGTIDRNGCSQSDSVLVSLTDDPLLGVNVDVMDESCENLSDGSLMIISTNGGVGPINYTVDGEAIENGFLENLSGGQYLLTVSDANDCQLDTTIAITSGESIQVNLGPDQVLPVESELTITPQISGDLFDFGWFVNGAQVNDATSDRYTQTVLQDLVIIFQGFTENGCRAVDTVLVDAQFTLSNVNIYIPNALKLDDTGPNGQLKVSLPNEVISIDEFRVFDRWGGLVSETIAPAGRFNVPLWNGTRAGESVNPGVYVYICKVTTAVEGQSKFFTGNITVLD